MFRGVTLHEPLTNVSAIYIMDTSYRGWEERVRVEVGELYEEGGVYFLAESVEEADA